MKDISRVALISSWMLLLLLFPEVVVSQEAGSADKKAAVLVDFEEPNEKKRWITVNDNVMGGRSKGSFEFKDQKLIFSGSTNTNGGGFSSIRTKPQQWETADADGIVVRVRGDGRTYKADLLTDNKMRGMSIAYRADFETKKDEWQEIKIPFEKFNPTLFGSNMKGRTRDLNRSKIETIGFMIYDKKDGAFQLEVDWVKTYQQNDAEKKGG